MSEGVLPDSSQSSDTVPVLADTVRPEARLHYLHSYSYLFESPNWGLNLLLTTVTMMIPVVGPIVLAGYQYEIVESLHRWPKRTYPDFDFGRFGDYLARGVWAFLVGMIKQMMIGMAYGFLYFACVIIIALSASAGGQQNSNQAAGIAAMIVIPAALLFLFGLGLVLRFITQPLILRASLTQDAGQLFNFQFMTDFIRRTWREMILEQLWLAVTTPIVTIFGLMLCFVGIYPAWAWVCMADAQTNWQLYEIYLARGGEEIPLKNAYPSGHVVPAQYYNPSA